MDTERRIRHRVEVDEPSPTVGTGPEDLALGVPAGEEIWEELGETFVENVTGADDAASERRAEADPEELAGEARSVTDEDTGPEAETPPPASVPPHRVDRTPSK
jgi:hypothetical protein